MPSLDHWNATWRELDIAPTQAIAAVFDDLLARHSEPHRKYHTLTHLDECFGHLEALRACAEHPAEVDLALWFHDAVYDTRSSSNEARSAKLAADTLLAAGGPADVAARVESLVMATRHDAKPASIDERIVVDVDLAILGAPPARFDEYERQVREEYAWVPGFAYRRERLRILDRFLARPAIFTTKPFVERYEARARANLQRSIDALHGRSTPAGGR